MACQPGVEQHRQPAPAPGRERQAVDRERARQISHHHDRSIEHSDEEQVLTGIVPIDLGGELADPGGQFLFRNKDARQVTVELGLVHGLSLPQAKR